MIWITMAAVLAFLFITYLMLVGTDGAWSAVGAFWIVFALAVIIIWMSVHGLTELYGVHR